MTPLPITLAALFLTMKSFTGAFSSNSRLDVREVKTEFVRALSGYFWNKVCMCNQMVTSEIRE